MTPLERLQADQHEDLRLASDHAFFAFLAEIPVETVLHDRLPHTAVELRHLARVIVARRAS